MLQLTPGLATGHLLEVQKLASIDSCPLHMSAHHETQPFVAVAAEYMQEMSAITRVLMPRHVQKSQRETQAGAAYPWNCQNGVTLCC